VVSARTGRRGRAWRARSEAVSKAANLRPVSRAAWAAALVGLPEQAEKWAGRAAMSQDSGPRAWSELTRVYLSLAALGPQDNTLAGSVVSTHIKALDALMRTSS
jgi:hypothetical protein